MTENRIPQISPALQAGRPGDAEQLCRAHLQAHRHDEHTLLLLAAA